MGVNISKVVNLSEVEKNEVIYIPRSWMPGNKEWKIEKGVFSFNEIFDVSENQNGEKITYQHSINLATPYGYDHHQKMIDHAFAEVEHEKAENQRREARCQEIGVDLPTFKKMLFLHKFPNSINLSNIYVFRQKKKDTHIYKIGMSNCPSRRIKEINTSNPHDCKLVFFYTGTSTREREKMIHAELNCYRTKNNGEWFDFESERSSKCELEMLMDTFRMWEEKDREILNSFGLDSSEVGIKFCLTGKRRRNTRRQPAEMTRSS